MKVAIDLEVWWDGQDEDPLQDQLQAIKDMIKSGAESFNFDVQINKVEEVVAPQIFEDKAEWGKNCGSCKFLDTRDSRRTKRSIFVKLGSPKCPEWRYFA